MSLAENLLNSLSENDYENSRIGGSVNEEQHIVIDENRRVTVPDNLKTIAVMGDKDIETVTIDCIRYWDGHDLSDFAIYINYILPNGDEGTYIPQDIDKLDDVFSFPWVIGREITYNSGKLVFWIVAKLTDDNGDLIYQWSSFQNFDCSIATGGDKIYVPEKQTDQDVISQAISVSRQAADRAEAAADRAEAAGGGGGSGGSDITVDKTLTILGAAADAKIAGDFIRTLNDEKTGYTDIVNDLNTNNPKKPLSAAQGVALKAIFENALGAYITDIDNIVGGGIEGEETPTIKGVWLFNESIADGGEGAGTYTVSFSSYAFPFTTMDLTYEGYGYTISYDNTAVMTGASGADSGYWNIEQYRTVDFGDTEQVVPEEFLAWMQAHATKISDSSGGTG